MDFNSSFDYKKTCKGKVAHNTEQDALKDAAGRTMKLYTYECPYCWKWHLTRSKPRKGQ